jgi:hypothetical protein
LSKGVAENVAKFKSSIVQLAYAIARAAEPGARQLSEGDIKRALTVIGAQSGNPEALKGVLLQLLNVQYKQVQGDVNNAVGRAASLTGGKYSTDKLGQPIIIGGNGLYTKERALANVYGAPLAIFHEQSKATRTRIEDSMAKYQAQGAALGTDAAITPIPQSEGDQSVISRAEELARQNREAAGGL